MRDYKELLEVVNDQGEVVNQATREEIHKKGLLHREVRIWVYNANGEILFQRRGPHKDTFPNLLDTSVGGHVDLGMTYDDSALKELEEETGIKAKKENLVYWKMERRVGVDKVTGTTNNAIRKVFLYKLPPGQDLILEKGKATSLEFWSKEKLRGLSEEEKKQFIPGPLEQALTLEI